MSGSVATIIGPSSGAVRNRGGEAVEVSRDISAFEAPWRMLEEHAVATPYQRYDWVRSFIQAGVEDGLEPSIVLMRNAAGQPIMLLPLAVRRQAGFRIASFIGNKHANFKLPLTCPALARSLDAERQRTLLIAAGRGMGADAFDFEHVPRIWNGEPVPLAALGRPSPSNAYGVTLEPDPETALKRAMSAEGRRKLRTKENGLKKLGAVEFVIAADEAQVDLILSEFLKQKADRFREQGIRDPFAGQAASFLRSASLSGLAEGRPAIEVSAVTLDGRVIAAFGAAVDRHRISGMFISFDPEFGRYSPGDQLVARVISDSAARGRTVFDLGVGEAEYKRRFCSEAEELVDVQLPVSRAGALFVAARAATIDLKRRVKQSDRAMGAIRAGRRIRARVGF